MDWTEGLQVPTVDDQPDFDVLYWVGCAAAYDRRSRNTARAMVQLLQAAGVRFAVLGERERCTGESARRMGEEFVFAELAAHNVKELSRHGVTRIVTHCPHCLNSLKHDYPDAGGHYEVVHHSEFLAELVSDGRLQVDDSSGERITYHDPCYLARVGKISEPPRQLIQLTISAGGNLQEMPRRREQTACCGAGGGRMWFDDPPDQRAGRDRIDEIVETGCQTVAVGCPFCLTMISDGLAASDANIEVQDIAELCLSALETSPIMNDSN